MIEKVLQLGLLDESDVARFARHGHFVYESGDHGDTWLSLELLFAAPARLHGAAANLAESLRRHSPELICGPLLGGALLGQWVAHALDLPFVYAEPRSAGPDGGPRYAVPAGLRPLLPDRRVAIVDDVINAGAATLAALREVETQGGEVVAAACLIARAPGAPDLLAAHGLQLESLIAAEWNTWPPAACPLCRAGIPLDPLP